ncbi:hypothetical protein M1N23_02780 [Dehalococcoidia bacterium]|nr:hypothetical protein [Dehalococcoidia bacterium]
MATFGMTNISYHVVTEPIYSELTPGRPEGVVRVGRVISERPSIVTPYYASNLQGFSSEAYEYLHYLTERFGPNSPGILYQYRNESEKLNIVSGDPREIANKISDDLDERSDNLSVVMVGVDELWDVALLKFMYEFTASSAGQNIAEFKSHGLLDPSQMAGGLPNAAIHSIERMFAEAENGRDPEDLKRELDRWGAFYYYEERFLNLYRRKQR